MNDKAIPISENLPELSFQFGDYLPIGGHWNQIDMLQEERKNFATLSLPEEMDEAFPAQNRSPLALAIGASNV